VITLSTFRPEYFNNNGDQGNIEVLERQLSWRGVPVATTSVGFESADFLLIGDASRAAMRHFESELLALGPLLQGRLAQGLPTLLVGSAFEFFSRKVQGLPALESIERVSEFRSARAAQIEGFGYRNSDSDRDLFVSGGFIGTTLFGPILAKSPEALSLILESLGVKQELPEQISSELDLLVTQARRTNAG
jgi:CobQ-like glutamine amidotransferase family enzyme